MKRILLMLCLALASAHPPAALAQEGMQAQFRVLAYHDVRDDPQSEPDRYTVSTRNLAEHFGWLRENGYQVVSVNDILAARAGGKALPPKSVLLTFDDGYRSVYTRVFPLLKAFNYPAVVGLVGSWLEVEPGGSIGFDKKAVARDEFLQWGEIREMVLSGLVEIASHSYDLHRGVTANPQKDSIPAAIARLYDAASRQYEDDTQYAQRLRADLDRNSALIARHLGARPRVMVWPYGRNNPVALRIAREAGLSVGFALDSGTNTRQALQESFTRDLVAYDPSVAELATVFNVRDRPNPVRVMHVDLDYVYDANPAQQLANVGALLDRVKAMGVNTVFLQAYADPDGNGAADAVYFPNRHLPVRADLFSHVAWQLHTRALVNVYAWMPVLAFELPPDGPAIERVKALPAKEKTQDGYPRLSPFDARARRLISEVYEDLARYSVLQGLLFHDDATLSDYEDSGALALKHYAEAWGLPPDIGGIRADARRFAEWSRNKSRYLTRFTLELGRIVKRHQQLLLLGRNLYARAALEPEAETWLAQNLQDFLASYDYTAIMAMPFLEQAKEPLPWLRSLAQTVAKTPRALGRSIFELQSRDWRARRPVDSAQLAQQMRELRLAGALNFGYYPDDFLRGHPELSIIKPELSLESFPYADVRKALKAP